MCCLGNKEITLVLYQGDPGQQEAESNGTKMCSRAWSTALCSFVVSTGTSGGTDKMILPERSSKEISWQWFQEDALILPEEMHIKLLSEHDTTIHAKLCM